MDAPVLGVAEDTYTGPNRWQVSMSWRHQRSDRHYVGNHEETQRQTEGSEVINHINVVDLGIRYNATPRWSFSVGIPYFRAARSSGLRGANREIIARSRVGAEGVGDIVVKAQRLLFKPLTHPNGNVSFGLGVKFPTGEEGAKDERLRLVNGQFVTDTAIVDQSIQPGDGGTGFILDVQGFQRIPRSSFALYGSASYLFNPKETNGVPTGRGGAGEAIMSVADQYVARLGASYAFKKPKGVGASLGLRLEGVPVEDLIGGSKGFRRPGYAISADPGVSYSWGPNTLSLGVPYALYRNRTRSVPDRTVPGRHGDAAFADYILFLGYWRRY